MKGIRGAPRGELLGVRCQVSGAKCEVRIVVYMIGLVSCNRSITVAARIRSRVRFFPLFGNPGGKPE